MGGDRWLDEAEDAASTTGRPARGRWLLLVAAVPWVLVAVVLAAPVLGLGRAPAPGTHDQRPAADGLEAPAVSSSVDPDGPPPAAEPDAAPRTAIGAPQDGPKPPELTPREERAAAALAVVVARAWLTGLLPALAIDGAPPPDAGRYAEHVAVEAIDVPASGAVVATVLAVVLHDEPSPAAAATGGLRTEVQRIPVPIARTVAGPRPAGTPWLLAPPELTPALPARTPIDDPGLLLEAMAALDAAGLDGSTLVALEATDGWPVLAELADGEATRTVWLRRDGDTLAVAGNGAAVSGIAESSDRADQQEVAP